MVSKCANPNCSATFRYLHDGRVYRLHREVLEHRLGLPHPALPLREEATTYDFDAFGRKGPQPAQEYYWLCGDCSRTMTLRFTGADVVLEAAVTARKTQAAAA